jgi:hypothetical protein
VEVVVAAIGAVVGDFGLVDLGLVLGYLLTKVHLLFYLGDQTLIFLFYYLILIIDIVSFDECQLLTNQWRRLSLPRK